MAIVVDEEQAPAHNRLTAIRLTVHTLRFMENWRTVARDYETLMVLIAVVAITAERLTRSDLDPELRSLDREIPADALARCNVSSIAAATGLNRETARRKVNEMVAAGLLVRSGRSAVAFAPGYLQRDFIIDLVRKQLDAVVRLLNDLLRDNVLKVQ